MNLITFIAWYMLTGIGYMIGHIVFISDVIGDKYSGNLGTLILNAIIFPINIVFLFVILAISGINSLQKKEK
jgi:ABC-type Na+ efflux pump permease subunit